MAKRRTIRIQKAVYRGFGLGYLFGKPVFLLHAYPGEKVEALVRRKGRKVFRGEVLEVIEDRCQHRITPKCPYVGDCGGCHHQELEYGYQLSLKKGVLEDTLHYIGKFDNLPEIETLPSPEIFRYRPQCGFQVQPFEGNLRLGYYRYESHDFIPIDDCLLLHSGLLTLKNTLEECLAYLFDDLSDISYVDCRMSVHDGKVALVLGFLEKVPPCDERLLEQMRRFIPQIESLLIKGWREEYVIASGTLHEQVNGVDYTIGPGSFFQNNHFQWPRIQNLVAEKLALNHHDRLLDLFCGVGFWAIGVGRAAAQVCGVENNPLSIELARQNAKNNQLERSTFQVSDLSQGLEGEYLSDPTAVIVNPPRSGCSRRLMNQVAQLPASRVMYVSCDPPSLARDLARLVRKGGFTIDSITFIDMFPHTFSIETAVLLTR